MIAILSRWLLLLFLAQAVPSESPTQPAPVPAQPTQPAQPAQPPQPPTVVVTPPQVTTWDVGPGLAAMLIAVVTAIGTTITVVINAILSAKARKDNTEKLETVKATGEETHKIVNSQRTEMTAEMKRQAAELAAVKDALREVTVSRDLARGNIAPEEKKIQIEIKTEDPKAVDAKVEEKKADA